MRIFHVNVATSEGGLGGSAFISLGQGQRLLIKKCSSKKKFLKIESSETMQKKNYIKIGAKKSYVRGAPYPPP